MIPVIHRSTRQTDFITSAFARFFLHTLLALSWQILPSIVAKIDFLSAKNASYMFNKYYSEQFYRFFILLWLPSPTSEGNQPQLHLSWNVMAANAPTNQTGW